VILTLLSTSVTERCRTTLMESKVVVEYLNKLSYMKTTS
jgi:hypothetical protein